MTENIISYDANSLHLYCSGDVMPCGNENSFDQNRIAKYLKVVLKGRVFGFAQVDIGVTDELYDKFSDKEKTGKKQSRKPKSAMKAKMILLYTPMIRWYLQHGLRLTTVHQLVDYEQGKSF